jgi:chitinase
MRDGRRLSPVRILVLLAVCAGAGIFAANAARDAWARFTRKDAVTWYAPYVDVTAQPTLHFEDPATSPARYHVLGFIVADPKAGCSPTWGTYYDLDGAGRALDLDRRIARLRDRGGDAIVSFGGAANSELATACTSVPSLTAAYRSVIERYRSTTVDFDIEGAALGDQGANMRRATAIAAIAAEARKAGHPLHVWLTLPVTPKGLTGDALTVVAAMIRSGAPLDGVNVMTMDYGADRPSTQSLRAANEAALRATATQVGSVYRDAGVTLTPAQVWRRIGATPMLGRNDTPGDVFGPADAVALVSFARSVGLGRVSAWSENRDAPCGVSDDGHSSSTCSGVEQGPLAFTWELLHLNGRLPSRAQSGAVVSDGSRDDPAASPYAIWLDERAYDGGAKVVWHGNVYEAKWWTQGDTPDAPVSQPWKTPWRFLGPVLATDRASSTAPPGAASTWAVDEVYLRGARVLLAGRLYEARWWTQGDRPDPAPVRPADTPWTLVGDAPAATIAGDASVPAWNASASYEAGSRVVLSGVVFQARWPIAGIRPKADAATPASYPWLVVGHLAVAP